MKCKIIWILLIVLFAISVSAKTVPTDYNSVTGKCEWRPTQEAVCGDATYNPLTDHCEVFPVRTIICEADFTYNPQTDKCEKIVPTEYLCDGVFDPVTKKCTKEVEPTINRICPDDAVLYQNPTTLVYSCIYQPTFVIQCDEGDYDGSLDKCVYIPESVGQCRAGETYDSGQDICIYEPETETLCISGTYDDEKNACIITPNLDYLCINGALNDDKTACLIIPKTVFVCPDDTTYDIITEKCLFEIGEEGVVTICPERSYYNSDEKKCYLAEDNVIILDEDTIVMLDKDEISRTLCGEDETFDPILGVCIIPWYKDRTLVFIAVGFVLFMLYLLWEKGPKSGLFRR